MTLILPPRIDFKCPCCHGLYAVRRYASWNSFNAVFYSDGTCSSETNYFACKCRFCGNYFLTRDFVSLSKEEAEIYGNPEKFSKKYRIDYTAFLYNCGSTNNLISYYNCREIEKMLKKGFFCPINASRQYKVDSLFIVYKNLWYSYNTFRKEIPDKKYNSVCKKLLSLFLPDTDDNKLMQAEINRNIGNFEKCEEYLDKITDKEKYSKTINKIKAACQRRIKNRIVIRDLNENDVDLLDDADEYRRNGNFDVCESMLDLIYDIEKYSNKIKEIRTACQKRDKDSLIFLEDICEDYRYDEEYIDYANKYRQMGKFIRCERMLDKVTDKEKFAGIIRIIREKCQKKDDEPL